MKESYLKEVSYRLPEAINIEVEGKKQVLKVGRVAVAGFVDWEDHTNKEDPDAWPYPLFTVDEELAGLRETTPVGGQLRSYWNLNGDLMTNMSSSLSQVIFSKATTPYVYVSNVGWPPSAYTILFETAVPYDQSEFEKAVKDYWSDEDFKSFYGLGDRS